MANESAVLWVDVDNNTLLTGWESSTPLTRPSFKQGDNIKAELHFVRRVGTNNGIFFEEVPTAGSTFKLAVGNPDATPTGGTWILAYGSEQAEFLYNASAASVQTALNAFAGITALGGVTVESVNGGTTYRISFNDKTALGHPFTGDGTNLLPSSTVIVDEIKEGSSTVRGVWQVKPTQIPIAYQGTWTAQGGAAISATTVQSGTTRIKISPAPKEGTFVLSVGGTTTAPISVYATALEVQNAITAVEEGFEVKKSGAFIWDVSQTTTPLVSVTANGSGLISFDAIVGEINFNNYETATLLAGATTKLTTLEIEMTTGTSVATVLQTQCVIVANLINETIFTPTPFEEHIVDAPVDGNLYARKDGDWIAFQEEDNQGITQGDADARYLRQANNLSDLGDVATARTNLSVYSIASTDSLLALKANLSGATFTGKVNHTSVGGAAGLNIGIGGTSTSANVAGDLWITTGGTNLNFRDGTGAWRVLATQGQINTFSTNQIIAGSTSTAMLRVTQTGTGEALRVEDEANPDLSPFIVGADGRVGIHGTPAINTNYKLAIYNGDAVFSAGWGISFGDGTRLTSASGVGGSTSIWALTNTDFGTNGDNFENGDIIKVHGSPTRTAYAFKNYNWDFEKSLDLGPTAGVVGGKTLTASGSSTMVDAFGETLPYTVTCTISFNRQHPRINTGEVGVSFIEYDPFNPQLDANWDWVVTPNEQRGEFPISGGLASEEYYGDNLGIEVPMADPSGLEYYLNPSLSPLSWTDPSGTITITLSITIGGSPSSGDQVSLSQVKSDLGWNPLTLRYDADKVRAEYYDDFVTQRSLIDCFIQALNTHGSWSFDYNLAGGGYPSSDDENFLFRWDVRSSRFKFIKGTDLLATTAGVARTNTFSQPQVIQTTSTSPLLRLTQLGSGNALVVEDNTSPDATSFVVNANGVVGIGVNPASFSPPSQSILQVAGRATFNGLATYAPINIGTVGSTPTNLTNGDIWIGTALNFRGSDGSNRTVPVLNTANTFTANTTVNTLMTIQQTGSVDALSVQTTSATTTATTATFQQSGLGQNVVVRSINTGANQAALRVEQRGTGHALVVEDSANPDTSATFIDSSGRIGVNLNPATTTLANAVEVNGAVKANTITFDGTAQFKVNAVQSHTGGSDTHELLISYNGSTYKVGMTLVSTP